MNSDATHVWKNASEEISPAVILNCYRRFIRENCQDQVVAILEAQDMDRHFSIDIDMLALAEEVPVLSNLTLLYPDVYIKYFAEAGGELQAEYMIDESMKQAAERDSWQPKPNLHIRIGNLPDCFRKSMLSHVRSSDAGQFLQICGTVVRTMTVQVLESERKMRCRSRTCNNYEFIVHADVQQCYSINMPKVCPSDPRNNREGKKCSSAHFDEVEGGVVLRDFQEIRIQEQASKLSMGSMPRSISVILQDDLVDFAKAGDDVVLTGFVVRRWQPVVRGLRCELELVVEANSGRISNTAYGGLGMTREVLDDISEFWNDARESGQIISARNHVLKSFCPQIFGLYAVKLALALVLTGGTTMTTSDGMRLRGDSHLLMVGDPGTGKSQFLKFALKLTPRGVMTTGTGTTSAGLTCSAMKVDGGWQLEAGALVLADRGICCIDEFSAIRKNDRATIHEAMEQQTLSVAKAGLMAKLNTRATIIAASNPKGKYDPDESLSVNTAIATPLLSRFDIVLVLLDLINPVWDKTVATFILNNNLDKGEKKLSPNDRCYNDGPMVGAGSSSGRAPSSAPVYGDEFEDQDEDDAGEVWSVEKLKIYLSYIKKNIRPQLTPEANQILSAYYTAQRSRNAINHSRTTIRFLESSIRLAQAHAKFCWKDTCGIDDAVAAVMTLETSMSSCCILGAGNALQSSFPDDPDENFARKKASCLHQLGLAHLINFRGSREQNPHPVPGIGVPGIGEPGRVYEDSGSSSDDEDEGRVPDARGSVGGVRRFDSVSSSLANMENSSRHAQEPARKRMRSDRTNRENGDGIDWQQP